MNMAKRIEEATGMETRGYRSRTHAAWWKPDM